MTGWIIYSRQDYELNKAFARFFVDAGRQRGIDIYPMLLDDIVFGASSSGPYFAARNGVPMPDFVISRFRAHELSRHFEICGVPVFNNSQISYICNNKFLTHQYLSQHGVDMMDTLLCSHELFAPAAPDGLPRVVKSVDGHGGSEVFLAASPERYIACAADCAHGAVAQPVCSEPGRDVRVYVLGRDVIGCVLRESDSDFRSNFSLGGRVSAYELTSSQRAVVDRITSLFDFGLAGIDFIFDGGRFVLNEIEDVVGCRMLYNVSTVDPVTLYLDFIQSRL